MPAARAQIIHDLGPILRDEKSLLPGHPNASTLTRLLNVLGRPVSADDEVIAELARSMVVLRQPAVLVVGAGMSYDRMPITKELTPLLAQFLSAEGEANPMNLIERDEGRVWERVRQAPERFQALFAGKTIGSVPGPQHRIAAELLREGHLAHIISFNWDDLIERSWTDQYGDAPPVIRQDGVAAVGPSLWKQHGDVANFRERWVLPTEPGRVFRSLTQCVDALGEIPNPPSHAVIVGYREAEPVVQDQLIRLLERSFTVIRVRPGLEARPGNLPWGAREFFEALHIEIELQKRAK